MKNRKSLLLLPASLLILLLASAVSQESATDTVGGGVEPATGETALKLEVDKLVAEVAARDASINALQAQLDEARERMKSMAPQEELKKEQEKSKRLEAQVEETKNQLAAALADSSRKQEALSAQLKQKDTEIGSLNQSKAALTGERDQLARERDSLTSERTRLEGELLAARGDVDDLQSKMSQLRAMIPKGLLPEIIQTVFGSPCRNRIPG